MSAGLALRLIPFIIKFVINRRDYLTKLKERRRESRAYTKHQLVGLELAQLLDDDTHKSLYIKLAKNYNTETLLRIAKRVVENKRVKNKGAYFMSIIFKEKQQ